MQSGGPMGRKALIEESEPFNADREIDVQPEDIVAPLDYAVGSDDNDQLEEADRRQARLDVALLQQRVSELRDTLEGRLRAQAQRADASAHRQLGNHPWGKLALAAIGVFVATRIVRRLPLKMITTEIALGQLRN